MSNKLRYVIDAVVAANYKDYIDNRPVKNFDYDTIGNLIKDSLEKISNISWNVYGKISQITKNTTTVVGDLQLIRYGYDASGNRIRKTAYYNQDATNYRAAHTWYVRDASGNVMATYTSAGLMPKNSTRDTTSKVPLYLSELHMYGSSRLGIWSRNVNMDVLPAGGGSAGLLGTAGIDTFNRGNKFFELSNHLGNVLVTVSDRKLGQNPVNGLYSSYTAEVVSASDYAPFGMQMVGRTFSTGSYRYGFNGKENDKEVKGEGNQQDYGMRIYDPRLGKFLSVDPLTKDFPMLTPYQFASNTPIAAIDLDGMEADFNYSSMVNAIKSFKASDVKSTFHKNITMIANNAPTPKKPEKWNDLDMFTKNMFYSAKRLHSAKENFVHDYRSIINEAAKMFDIPPVLLAGVAYNEFGGAPPVIDDLAYGGRLFNIQSKDPQKTSFGDLSLQVKTAMETLGYNTERGKSPIGVENEVINSLNDPKQAFFIAAKHLSDLRDIDFPGTRASKLGEAEIEVIGARYNRGKEPSLKSILGNLSYGKAITKRIQLLRELIKESEKPK